MVSLNREDVKWAKYRSNSAALCNALCAGWRSHTVAIYRAFQAASSDCPCDNYHTVSSVCAAEHGTHDTCFHVRYRLIAGRRDNRKVADFTIDIAISHIDMNPNKNFFSLRLKMLEFVISFLNDMGQTVLSFVPSMGKQRSPILSRAFCCIVNKFHVGWFLTVADRRFLLMISNDYKTYCLSYCQMKKTNICFYIKLCRPIAE